MTHRGCEAYFAFVLVEAEGPKLRVEDILVVREFSDVCPEKLPGLPPEREIEFAIEVQSSTDWMVPAELKELKTKLRELIDKGFVRPSVSP